jgi:hypothetical protein
MSFAAYPWEGADHIRRHFSEKREAEVARHLKALKAIDNAELAALDEHDKILALGKGE